MRSLHSTREAGSSATATPGPRTCAWQWIGLARPARPDAATSAVRLRLDGLGALYEAEFAKARADRLAAEAAGEQWLEQNGAALAELWASERELTRRREADYDGALQAARIGPADHVIEHLGSRPEDLAGREAWDYAAAKLLHYEQRFGEPPGGDEPTVSGQARAWRSLQRGLQPPDERTSPLLAIEQAAELDRGGDLDLGP